MGFPLDVRVLFGVIGVLFSLGCEPAKDAAVTIPTGAVQLRFPELDTELCGADRAGCGGASRPYVANVRGVAFNAEGTKVALQVDFFHLGLICDVLGCIQNWERVPKTVCYALEGANVSPTTDCPSPPSLAGMPSLQQSEPADGYPLDHTQRRAFFGVPNANATLTAGTKGVTFGARWLGDLDVRLDSPNAWDLAFAADVQRSFVAVIREPRVELVLPPVDGVKLANGLLVNDTGVYWASQADEVFALSLDDSLRLTGRRVRSSITRPQTKTVGLRELSGEVISVVLTPSANSVEGGVNTGDVFEVSLLRTPKRDEAPRALVPFGPFTAHAPTATSVVTCFTQPLEAGTLAASQFSISGVEVKSAALVPGVPQCARLSTGVIPRNATVAVSVEGLKALSGDVVKGASISLVAPDAVVVPGVEPIEIPAGTKASYPLSDGTLLITQGAQLARVDVSGVAVESIATLSAANFNSLRVDESVQGFWLMGSNAGAVPVVSLQTSSGAVDLGRSDVVAGGVFEPVRDGTVLLNGAMGPNVMRLSATTREALPRVTNTNFRGVFAAGKVLVEDQGALRVVTLPDSFEAQTFALPSGIGATTQGPAFTSDGVTWWCAGGNLYRLEVGASAQVMTCNELSADGDGALWVTSQVQTLARVRGLTVREVTVLHPFSATPKKLLNPKFKGGAVWFENDTLRIDTAEWAVLAGVTP